MRIESADGADYELLERGEGYLLLRREEYQNVYLIAWEAVQGKNGWSWRRAEYYASRQAAEEALAESAGKYGKKSCLKRRGKPRRIF